MTYIAIENKKCSICGQNKNVTNGCQCLVNKVDLSRRPNVTQIAIKWNQNLYNKIEQEYNDENVYNFLQSIRIHGKFQSLTAEEFNIINPIGYHFHLGKFDKIKNKDN